MKVVIGGPPHSGKSTFTAKLVQIMDRFNLSDDEFSYLTLDVTDNSLNYLLEEDDVPKKLDIDWTEEEVAKKSGKFANKAEDLVVSDAPGKIDDKLRELLEPADSMIIVSQDEEEIEEWEAVAESEGLNIVAKFKTVIDEPEVEANWDGTEDSVGLLKDLVRGSFLNDQLDPKTERIIFRIADRLLDEAI